MSLDGEFSIISFEAAFKFISVTFFVPNVAIQLFAVSKCQKVQIINLVTDMYLDSS